jgi:hypothetical protein
MLEVTYILGFERTGSTLLHDVLALKNGSMGVGESRHIYKQFLLKKNSFCGCGLKFSVCPFWNNVILKIKEKGFDPHEVKIKDSSLHNIWRYTYYPTSDQMFANNRFVKVYLSSHTIEFNEKYSDSDLSYSQKARLNICFNPKKIFYTQ